MAEWSPTIALAQHGAGPLFKQIADAIVGDIRRGRLRPGAPLPGTRSLADALGVHRNTVLAAYADLTAEGWTTTERARGTYVNRSLPEPRPRAFAPTRDEPVINGRPAFSLPRAPHRDRIDDPPPGVVNLSAGMPDPRLVPRDVIGRAIRRALRQHGGSLLDYGDVQGHPSLRRELARMLCATRGIAAQPENVLVTRGSQMGLYLVGQAILGPEATVAVEAWGYRPAWRALSASGATLVPVRVDGHGLDVDQLENIIARQPLHAVYLTPHHQYPTTVTLAAARRLRLLELARRHRFAIIEDDYDHEFHFEGRPILPLASADAHGSVVYVGTLSKVLAPGLRLGYVVAPPPVIDRLTGRRLVVDRQGDLTVEAAVAELLEEGEVQRHARRMRRIYRRRRDALVAALHQHLRGVLTFTAPSGGMALWARVAARIGLPRWRKRALAAGVWLAPSSGFSFSGRESPLVRLGFAAHTEAELERAVALAARSLQR